ncbi:serine/threonine-protein kinase 31-like isoform X2 [Tubulanus polymorphus]|uniref:serine/threonine-protein kinase 31-like isoform X2 n=1 Tax=Tubulanus polymorphus TaxID=672921 RepID=UPI003DA3FA48
MMSGGRFRPKTYDIFVGSLPSSATQNDLREMFLPFGEINSIEIRENQKLNDGTFLAFVRFMNEDDANVAAIERKNYEFRGNILHIQRTQKPGVGGKLNNLSSGGSGGGGGRWEGRNAKPLLAAGWGGSGDAEQPAAGMFQKPDLVADQSMKINNWQPMGNSAAVAPLQQNKTPSGKPPVTREHVLITHVETPSIFWGQVMSSNRAQGLVQLGADLANICQCFQAISGNPDFNKIYGAKFSADDQWYRSQPIRVVSEDSTMVRYIDYGNSEVVQNNAMMELPTNIATIKPYADKFILRLIEAIDKDENSEKYRMALAAFSNLTDGHLLDTEVYGVDSSGMKMVDIFFDGVSLNQDLLKGGLFAKKQTKNLRGPRNVQSPPQQSAIGGPVSMPMPHSIPQNLNNGQNDRQIVIIKQQTETLRQSKAKIDELTREVLKTSNELQKAYGERDNAVLETATTKGRIKILQDKIKEISEQNINEKCKILAAGVASVRMIRRQFPTDDQTPDIINKAIGLAMDTEKKISSDTDLVRSVKQALEKYENEQNFIRTCTDLTVIDGLMAQRDASRISFYAALSSFLDITETMPLQSRGNDLKDSISAIKTTYSYYLSYGARSDANLEAIIVKFKEWRAQKLELFLKYRTITNTQHNIVSNSIKTIQQELSLDLDAPDCANGKVELDQYLNKFQESIQQELLISNLGSESVLVSQILQSLLQELESEVVHIEHLRAMRDEFIHLKSSIVRWLDEKPDITPLQTTRKTLKSLRSKLGHLLVDKNDLEESDEDNSEELSRVLEQLETIRIDLHHIFKQEDKHIAELADISINHFPELQVKHPELGISTYVQYNGLLKQSLDIDQFSRVSVQDKSHVWTSVFDNEPVFIKEYLIAESVGVSKDFFMQQAIHYNSIQGNYIAEIWAVFFYKNKQQAYVLSPLCTSLTKHMENTSLTGEEIHHILCSVLKGLETYHNNGLIYGAIHPDNILLTADGSVKLADYDFTKSPAQRAMNCKTGITGLLYNSPEGISQQIELTLATDIFSFGILMIELLIPSDEINVRSDGRPNKVQYESGPCQIVHHLLSVNHMTRPVISQLLSHGYFANPYEPPPPEIRITAEDVLQLRGSCSDATNARKGAGILKNVENGDLNEDEQQIADEIFTEESPEMTSTSNETVDSNNDVNYITIPLPECSSDNDDENDDVSAGEESDNKESLDISPDAEEENDDFEEAVEEAVEDAAEVCPDVEGEDTTRHNLETVSSPPDIVPTNDVKSIEEFDREQENPDLGDESEDEETIEIMPSLESDNDEMNVIVDEMNFVDSQISEQSAAAGEVCSDSGNTSKAKQLLSSDDKSDMED